MKLRNKETGEIAIKHIAIRGHNEVAKTYNSLAELNKEWEDVPDTLPDTYYLIDGIGGVNEMNAGWALAYKPKEIGNYFETKEEAEKAVEKLKAWKRLKDNGFKIEGIRYRNNRNYIEWSVSQKVRDDHFMAKTFNDDLHLLFGGEE